jgi:hypothetical protein
VERFNNLLKNNKKKLFISINLNCNEFEIDKNIIDIIKFNDEFNKYTNDYNLIVIINYSNNNIQKNIIHNVKNIIIIELFTFSKSNGTEFINDDDNIYLNNIINEIIYNFK